MWNQLNAVSEDETFHDLHRDDFLQATVRVGRRALRGLELAPYPVALLRHGLRTRIDVDHESSWILDQAMEYAGAVGVMAMEQVALVNEQVLTDHTFGGTALRDFMLDHEERLAEVESFPGIMDGHLWDLQRRDWIQQDGICDLRGLVDQLLERVTVLEGRRDTPIEIPDSPVPLPIHILLPVEHQLVPIEELNPDSGEDKELWAIAEDQARVLEGRDAEELGLEGELFVDGENILDVLRRRNLRGDEVPEYEEPPEYNDPGYTSDH